MTGRPATPARLALAAAVLCGCALAAPSADVVILKDGFAVQGKSIKEMESIFDKASGQTIRIVKGTGQEMIDEGAKVTIFSSHFKRPDAAPSDVKIRPDMKGYMMPFPGQKSGHQLPSLASTIKTSDFNDKWVRTISVKVPETRAPEEIEQQITYMDPYYIRLISPTHYWRLTYRTNEWDPKLIRKLLLMHPEIAEPDGKPDPIKRVALAKFMLDAGWLQVAKDEVDRLDRDFKGEMKKDAKEQYEKLKREIDEATAELVARESELALAAGRYKYTGELLAAFPEKLATAVQKGRVAKVAAELKTNLERYDTGRRLLRAVTEGVTGRRAVNPLIGLAGGLATASWQPRKDVPTESLELAAAAEQVSAELHPDSALRVETFVTLAAQAERERMYGREPTKKPAELLAAAVSGWAKGRNGATPNPGDALKLWRARELVLTYQRAETLNDRNDLVGQFKRTPGVPVDELAQMISLLPPADPEDLENRTGRPVKVRGQDVGVYRRTTLPAPGFAGGLDYLVRPPSEYHHGRAYPVLVVLTHTGIGPDDIIGPLLTEADKNGYVLVVPEWTGEFNKTGWGWKGEDHVWVTAALRDAVRHFTVDNDRVFLMGVGEGGNMAMDVGASHPDLFAGVIPMCPLPNWTGLFVEYWKNAQKLPFYVVSGEMDPTGAKLLRLLYERWTRYGYPSLWSVYKGRGVEWFASEVPTLFDWMNRKTRATPAATLKDVNPLGRQDWQIMRQTDNRFYWVQADSVHPGRNGGVIVPATISGDLQGNKLRLSCKKVGHVTVWLTPDLIDFTKPVQVTINSVIPNGYPRQGKVVEPSLEVLLEDYHARGDRRMLFLNKLEFPVLGVR
jgi:predicted esterase